MLPIRKILCPTDFSEPSYEALKAAEDLTLYFSAELYLVNVVNPIPAATTTSDAMSFNVSLYQQELEKSAQKSL
jgi:nucleotide-binding universal stress UspA family protein